MQLRTILIRCDIGRAGRAAAKALIYLLFACVMLMPLHFLGLDEPIREATATYGVCGGTNNNTCNGLSEANCGLAAPCCSWEPIGGGGGGYTCKKVACNLLGADCHTCGCNMMCDYNCHGTGTQTVSTDACSYGTPGACVADPCCKWGGSFPGGSCDPQTCTQIDTQNCSTTCGCNDDWLVNISGDVCYISDNRTIWGDMEVSRCAFVAVMGGTGMDVKGQIRVKNDSTCTNGFGSKTTTFAWFNKTGQKMSVRWGAGA